jgi:hypothetical protein
LTFSGGGDQNGVFYWFGSHDSSDAVITWGNPVPDRVTITNSVGAVEPNQNYATDRVFTPPVFMDNGTMEWRFPTGYTLLPNKEVLRGRTDDTNHQLRNWRLDGQKSDDTWETFTSHSDDTCPSSDGAWCAYDVTSTNDYKAIRFIGTGLSSIGTNYMAYSELELYGTLTYPDPPSSTTTTTTTSTTTTATSTTTTTIPVSPEALTAEFRQSMVLGLGLLCFTAAVLLVGLMARSDG